MRIGLLPVMERDMIRHYTILMVFALSSFGAASANSEPIAPLTAPSKAKTMTYKEDRPQTIQKEKFGVVSADGEPVAPLTAPSKPKTKKAKEDNQPSQRAAPNASFTDAAKINQDPAKRAQ